MTRKRSYQKGSVELHNGQWSVRYREYNHATRKWTLKREQLGEFKNKKAARRAAEPIMARVNERNNTDKPPDAHSDLTFRQFVETRWKAYTMSSRYQPSTLDAYGSITRIHLLPHFGEMRLGDVRPADISEFLERLQPKKALNTLQGVYRLLRLMFDLACQYDLIETNPVRPKLHRPESARVDKPTLNAAEIQSILASLGNPQERLLTLLIALTGIRLGECMALRWVDFDAVRCELQINHTLYRDKLKPPKTESSRRAVYLVPQLAGLLAAHKEKSAFQADADFIFCRADGRPVNPMTLRNHLHKAMDKAKVKWVARKYGFHIFRHTAGTLIYSRSRDLKLVQGALGHSNISTTSDIYVHLEDGVKSEGAEILAREILANCDLFVTQESRMVS